MHIQYLFCILFFIQYINNIHAHSLDIFIEPTISMFAWINSFMDKKNPIPYQKSIQELHDIVILFEKTLAIKNQCTHNSLEQDMINVITYQFNKLDTMYTILAEPNARELGSIRLGLKLAQVCQIPDLVEELDVSFTQMLKKAHTTDQLFSTDLQTFYTHSFQPFYTQWHDKSPLFFLQALHARLSY